MLVTINKREMKTVLERIGLENVGVKSACLFTRAKVGPHMGLLLDKGKANSILVGITHAKALSKNINTIDCDFSSLITDKVDMSTEYFLKKNASRAILTIVNNETMEYKNAKLLNKLKYSTGLSHYPEQEKLKNKVLFHTKIIYLSDEYNSKDFCILYQTKSKTEIVSINNRDRLVELIGMKSYDAHFKPLFDLSLNLGEQKLPIVEHLITKIDKEGIEGLLKIMKDLSC